MIDQDNFWCRKPFVEIDTNGVNARPCCVFENHSPIHLRDYFNNPEIISVRSDIIDGKIPVQCKNCVKDENLTGKSFRTQSNAFDLSQTDPNHLTVDNTVIYNVLLNSGNICNLKCIHCHGGSSYARGIEMYALGLTASKPNLIPAQLDYLYKTEFRKVTVLGGEPFYDKAVIDFLQKLPTVKNTHCIELDINTNLTHIDRKLIEFLVNHYHKVQIKGSIDGFDKSNDYLRYPSKWQHIENSVDMIKDFTSIELCITTSVSNLSLLHLPQLIKWVVNKGIRNHYFSIVNDPNELQPQRLPEALKTKIRDELMTLKEQLDLNYHDRTAELIELALTVCNTVCSANHIVELETWLERHDTHRKNSWKTVFPELVPFLENTNRRL